jgi:hypothetical protein
MCSSSSELGSSVLHLSLGKSVLLIVSVWFMVNRFHSIGTAKVKISQINTGVYICTALAGTICNLKLILDHFAV